MPQGKPRSGERYLHFKNKLYQIVTIAKHSETGEELVIYQALYDNFAIYARPLSMFISEVDHEKYPQIKQKYRFALVEENQEANEQDTMISDAEAAVPKTGAATDCVQAGQQEEASVESTMIKTDMENQNYAMSEENVTELLMAFYDARTYEEKYKILTAMRDQVTDGMINNMAVVLDVVISEGNLEKRYEELKRCLRTYEKYEVYR